MKDTANANCRELLDVLIAHGIRDIVASPGSRNTPLLIGASVRDELKTHLVNDERTAGFIALGMAISRQRPVALICTSGTALYNYAPAIAEAFYQRIPLIVISADRPSQWIDQDDSQTLHQYEALDKIMKHSYDISAETGMSVKCRNKEYATEREWYVNRIANEAVLISMQNPPGPVHINMQFAEPLNGLVEYEKRSGRIIRVIKNNNGLPPHQLKEISEYLLSKRIMVVAGYMPPDDKLNSALAEFTKLQNVTLLCETISNIHLDGNPYMIDSLLVDMNEDEREVMAPDIIISIGGALVSRMLKEYLRSADRAEHWTLSDTPLSVDCFQRLSTHLDVAPARFFKGISGMCRHLLRKGYDKPIPDYREQWALARKKSKAKQRELLKNSGWSEYTALAEIFKTIPLSYNLFLSNGTCVRYAQLLMDRLPHACYSNRGVSGIDGTNATAAGISNSYNGTTLLLTGDVSFGYCTEILNRKITEGDLRIVVINNSGGGIFRFIKTTRELEQREEYFCNAPHLPIEGIAHAYERPYMKVRNAGELRSGIEFLYGTPHSIIEIEVEPTQSAETLIEILTPRNNNRNV